MFVISPFENCYYSIFLFLSGVTVSMLMIVRIAFHYVNNLEKLVVRKYFLTNKKYDNVF